MAIQNRFFEVSSATRIQRVPSSRKAASREELLSTAIAEDLNTYKNFGIFHTRADVVVPKTDKEGHQIPPGYKGVARSGAIGVRSIFNAYSATLAGEDSNLSRDSRGVVKGIESAQGMSEV